MHSFVGRRQHCLTTIVDWWRSSLATYNSQCPKKEKNSSKKYFCVPNQYVLKKNSHLIDFLGPFFKKDCIPSKNFTFLDFFSMDLYPLVVSTGEIQNAKCEA